MHRLGYNNDTKKESFYVDGYNRNNVVANRQTFCKRYLTDYDSYCKHWVRLSVEEAKTTINLNMTFVCGYHNIITTNVEMIEFHVDYWSQHQQEAAANDNANNID